MLLRPALCARRRCIMQRLGCISCSAPCWPGRLVAKMEGRTSQHAHPYALHMRPSALALCTANMQVQIAKTHMFWAISNLERLHYARFRCALCAALCTALCTHIRCILLLWSSPDATVSASMQFIGIEDRESFQAVRKKCKSRDERVAHNATFHCL